MDWQFLVALVVAIPLILFPAALIWYISVGGIIRKVKINPRKKDAANKPAKTGK